MPDTLTITRTGNGPPLVLVHGYFGGAGHWTAEIAHFRDRYDVIAVNLAGFGDSAHLAAPESISDHAALVWGALNGLDIGPAALLGHSMGGMVVQEMTAQAPARVAKLILYGTGPVGNLPGRFEPIETSRQRLKADGLEATLRRIAATWLVDGQKSVGYARCIAEGLKATDQAALAALTAWQGWNGTNNLPAITAPTLIIRGQHDRSYPFAQAQALLDGISKTTLEILSECGHAAHLEKPALFHAALDRFLNSPVAA